MTEDEFRSGVMADGTRLMQPSNYIADAIRTCSPMFHGDMVADSEFRGVVNICIHSLNGLDQIKKSIFYGRDNNLIADGQNDVSDLPGKMGVLPREVATDIIHAILGIATEAGELLELLRATYNGEPFDWVNAQEELGDVAWYQAILANRGGFTFEQVQERNIAKLRARFPDKFKAVQANERNLANERAILEGGQLTETLSDPLRHVEASAQFEPTAPASGPIPVLEAAAKADVAFAALKAPSELYGEMNITPNAELGKGIGERVAMMPGENLARQPIRKTDLDS